ncbi:MAG TPA: hypothetical protein VFS43_20680 [Polyangiaceae bacterium]|nr:hypothetical protein [Polyangiaceae bacterium]
MNLPSYFDKLLEEIEPSPSYKDDQRSGHQTLRRRLAEDDKFGPIHVNTFLQGSYKRCTAIHPGKDVDVVVVTSLDPSPGKTKAAEANALLGAFLERHYKGKYKPQSRSYGITLSYVTLDVVLATSTELQNKKLLADVRVRSELEDPGAWLESPLWIPDRDLKRWVETDPKRQLEWTTARNAASGGFFVPLVKMFKWWRKVTYETPKYPKGYLLERIAGECCDVGKRDHAEGFVALLENIVAKYGNYPAMGIVPFLPDAGVRDHNVLGRLTLEDFATFMDKVTAALMTARAALAEKDKEKSVELWRQLFKGAFPQAQGASKASFPAVPVRPNKPAGFA